MFKPKGVETRTPIKYKPYGASKSLVLFLDVDSNTLFHLVVGPLDRIPDLEGLDHGVDPLCGDELGVEVHGNRNLLQDTCLACFALGWLVVPNIFATILSLSLLLLMLLLLLLLLLSSSISLFMSLGYGLLSFSPSLLDQQRARTPGIAERGRIHIRPEVQVIQQFHHVLFVLRAST